MSEEMPSQRIARWAFQLAAFGCFLLSLRVAWLTQSEFTPSFRSASGEPQRRRRDDDGAEPEPSATTTSPLPLPSAPPSTPQVRTLYVKLGPPRSAVYVNGVRLGETPYAGDWSCVDGDAVDVQVMPASGAPLHRSLRCAGTTLVVRERTIP